MRQLVHEPLIRKLMDRLGSERAPETRVYFTGGVSAVLMGWRSTTIDIDLLMVPEQDALMRAMPSLKEDLQLNIEISAPSHFIPELPGWQDRSPFIAREGSVSFHHYDFYSQALAKIERWHERDRSDVHEMLARGLVDPGKLREMFEAVVGEMYRYPAINPSTFRRALDKALSETNPH